MRTSKPSTYAPKINGSDQGSKAASVLWTEKQKRRDSKGRDLCRWWPQRGSDGLPPAGESLPPRATAVVKAAKGAVGFGTTPSGYDPAKMPDHTQGCCVHSVHSAP